MSKLFRKMMFFLIYSNMWQIRYRLVNQGYRLDILVNDPHSGVRFEVAKYGYGLDILINDKNTFVKELARRKQNEILN